MINRIALSTIFLCCATARIMFAETVSVCQLLTTPIAFDGKQVNLRGVYHFTPESTTIIDPMCNERAKHKDQIWSGAVWLNYSESMRSLHSTALSSDPSDLVWATFTGRIEYCPKQVKMGGKVQWLGCGHVGGYILQIWVDAVSDIEVKAREAPKSQ
jgi:hypothetical protein